MPIQEINDDTFEGSVKQKGTVLVDFGAPWCSPCRRLLPILEELDQELAGEVPILKVNVDESPESASAYGVMSMPTVIIFRDGQPVRKLVGLRNKPAYMEAVTG